MFPKMSRGSSFAISQESNLCLSPGNTTMNHVSKVPDHFSSNILLASKVNLNALKLPGDIKRPCMSHLNMAFQSKFWQ